MLNFIHSGSAGDIIYALPTIISLARKHNKRANLYLHIDVPADYYSGCIHPAGNSRMNKPIAEALIPLFRSQPYIDEVKIWEYEDIHVNLDLFRAVKGLEVGHLAQHYFYTFDTWYDLTKPWLIIKPVSHRHKVVVARTMRYRNPNIKYNFLSDYNPTFIGLEDEFIEFKKECPSATWYKTKSFLDIAQVISNCDCFISNQTAAFAIAEALKVPRVLEVCMFARNVQPQGGIARSATNQNGFEANVRDLVIDKI